MKGQSAAAVRIETPACSLQLKQDQWWRVESEDDTPYHKLAHDKLRDAGKLPDYS